MKDNNEIEVLQQLKKFLELYNYNLESREYINRYFLKDKNNNLMTEIYHAMQLYEENEDPYIGIVNIIEKNFSLDSNILEICCGEYPALSEIISTRQVNTKGTITAYDPNLVCEKLHNIKLYKEPFSDSISIEKYDLIIAIKPCDATSLIVNTASKEDKDYLISPCSCAHFSEYYEQITNNYVTEWYDHVYELCKLYKRSGTIEKTFLSPNYNYKYPIYIHKRDKGRQK